MIGTHSILQTRFQNVSFRQTPVGLTDTAVFEADLLFELLFRLNFIFPPKGSQS